MKNNKIQEFEVFVSSGKLFTTGYDDKSPINKELRKNSMNEIVLHLNWEDNLWRKVDERKYLSNGLKDLNLNCGIDKWW